MTAAGVVLVVCDKQHNYLCVCQRGWGGACARERRGWSRPLSPLSTVTGGSSLCRPHSSAGNEFYTETVTRDHGEIMAEVIQRKSVIERILSKAMLDTCYTCTLSVCLMLKCHFTLVCLLTNITKSYYWETTDGTLHNTHNVGSV